MKTRDKSVILNLFQNLTIKTITATALIGVSTTAFASLSDCYRAGANPVDDDKTIAVCEPYKDDVKVKIILSGAYSGKGDSAKALEYAKAYVDYYEKNKPQTKENILNLADIYAGIGNIYYFGSAEPKYPKDTTKGIEYITKGAELGSIYGSNDGEGITKNFSISYYWYELGRLNGGSSYSRQHPSYVHQNMDFFTKSGKYCLAVGDQMVAQAYLDGFGGLPKNKSAAKKYLTEAIDLYKADGKPTADEIKYCSPPKGSDISLESAEKLYKSL
ncbi:SEL1-like repeat protein [Francisella philomiragia]|uniref:SEL1-like repeat protein n=1 Tax=Francisella philomiragia TaxID=28110 RepID=UPI001903E843|nr:SEL1-like repeat protein [Francisella philomiragia]MBK2268315.1 SEL1-like repeat protein [Francisella philomiragia]MBK2308911.1 SEL1-like repeat protein [Francisella philomiragia]